MRDELVHMDMLWRYEIHDQIEHSGIRHGISLVVEQHYLFYRLIEELVITCRLDSCSWVSSSRFVRRC